MKRIVSTLFAVFCLCVVVFATGISSFADASSSTIYGKVVRLHVLANSDSEKDQQLKYMVRDRLLGVTNELFSDCKTPKEAMIVAVLVWFSLRVRGKCSIFQVYVYYWRQAFEFSLYQIKEICSSRSSLLSSFKIFIINEYEILSNTFSGSIEMLVCVPHSVNVVN